MATFGGATAPVPSPDPAHTPTIILNHSVDDDDDDVDTRILARVIVPVFGRFATVSHDSISRD